ncbi:hypothetical protein SAMN05444156_2052 [Verrucomicrobium sp. GAS474]|nr:hypothetical protein SAMN05444156_2052 [Verrucomicrobium sp. GAS474]
MALLLALALVALLSILVVSFFSSIQLNQGSQHNFVESSRAEEIGRGALQEILGDLRQEMDAGSLQDGTPSGTVYTVNGTRAFVPATNLTTVPARIGFAASAYTVNPVSETTKLPISLNRVSRYGATYPSYYATAKLPPSRASALSTTNYSADGHRLQAAFWGSPGLLGTSVPAAFAAAPPDWVYVTRSGGRPVSNVAQAGNYSDMANTNAVIGRYAFAMYDTSGLLDVNIAGYLPAEVAGTAGKGYASYADLTKLPGLNAAALKNLVQWRNGGGIAKYGTYTNSVGIYSTNGFRSMLAGDNPLFGRRDLVAYFDQNGLDKRALAYLSTFSRAVNASTWRPLTNGTSAAFAYMDNSEKTSTINRDMANVRKTNGDVYPAQRFPLSRLALLNTTPPATGDVANILLYFGLKWDATNKRWTYAHGTGGTYISRLDEIANSGRDPDFFELLKASLLSGSIGQHPGARGGMSTAGAMGDYFDIRYGLTGGLCDSQIIQIGVNIIDQYRNDNYPTSIYFPKYAGPDALENTLFNTFTGVKNLPYLSQIDSVIWQNTAAKVFGWLQPELWNPHGAAPPGTTVAGPTKLRIRPYCSVKTVIAEWMRSATSTSDNDWKPTPTSSTVTYDGVTAGNNLYFSVGADDYRDHPQPILFASLDAAQTSAANYMASSISWGGKTVQVVGFNAGSLTVASQLIWGSLKPSYPFTVWTDIAMTTAPSAIVLEYLAADGSWRPYNYLSRFQGVGFGLRRPNYLPDGTLASQTAFMTNAGGSETFPAGSIGSPLGDYALARVDPRTDRFSVSMGEITWPGKTDTFYSSSTFQSDSAKTSQVVGYWPGSAAASTGGTATPTAFTYSPGASSTALPKLAGFVQNTPGSTATYADPDGVVRPGDAWRQNTGSGDGSVLFHAGNSLPRRPVVLNRPFVSIAEMGYAFRDLPFRSLDFSSPLSADGGLLDAFCLQEQSKVVYGQVNPNAAPVPVLQALFAGGQQSPTDQTLLTDSDAAVVANGLAASLNPTTPAASAGAIQSRADLALRLASVIDASTLSVAGKANKAYREAPIRALASSNTRTWNLMIDIVAQSGRMKPSPSSLNDFVVEGQKRYWLHVAIDRYTGQIVDKYLEPIYE